MEQEVFVLMYKDVGYVKVDDSTGPMSTGGYPYRVPNISKATHFKTAEDAARYNPPNRWPEVLDKIFPVTITYTLGDAIDAPLWSECHHHCRETRESTAPSAKHFLDCPIWKDRLAAINR